MSDGSNLCTMAYVLSGIFVHTIFVFGNWYIFWWASLHFCPRFQLLCHQIFTRHPQHHAAVLVFLLCCVAFAAFIIKPNTTTNNTTHPIKSPCKCKFAFAAFILKPNTTTTNNTTHPIKSLCKCKFVNCNLPQYHKSQLTIPQLTVTCRFVWQSSVARRRCSTVQSLLIFTLF